MENASQRCSCVLVSSCTLQRCWHHLMQGMPLSPTHRWCPRTVQACPCQWFGKGLSLERKLSSVACDWLSPGQRGEKQNQWKMQNVICHQQFFLQPGTPSSLAFLSMLRTDSSFLTKRCISWLHHFQILLLFFFFFFSFFFFLTILVSSDENDSAKCKTSAGLQQRNLQIHPDF